MKRSNITGMRKDTWNKSTLHPGGAMCVRAHRQNAVHDNSIYKYNYRAEHLPRANPEYIPKASKLQFDRRSLITEEEVAGGIKSIVPLHSKRTEEMPVHDALVGQTAWNSSTYFPHNHRAVGTMGDDDKIRTSRMDARRRGKGRAAGSNPAEPKVYVWGLWWLWWWLWSSSSF